MSTSGARRACELAAPDDALRTIRPAARRVLGPRRLRRPAAAAAAADTTPACENANGSRAAALYPYSVIVRASVVGVHALASRGEIFGWIVSKAEGDGVLSSSDVLRGTLSISREDAAESSGCTRCREPAIGAGGRGAAAGGTVATVVVAAVAVAASLGVVK